MYSFQVICYDKNISHSIVFGILSLNANKFSSYPARNRGIVGNEKDT